MAIKKIDEKGEAWSHLVLVGAPDNGVFILYDYVVPARTAWRWRKVGNYLGTVAAWGFAYWEVLINGVRVPENGLIYDQIGYAASREIITPVYAMPGERVQVVAHNLTAANLQMGINMKWDLEYGE